MIFKNKKLQTKIDIKICRIMLSDYKLINKNVKHKNKYYKDKNKEYRQIN